VLLAVLLIAGILLGAVTYLAPVAGAVYLAGAARTYFDDDTANKVLAREREERRRRLRAGRSQVRPEQFAPPIRHLLDEARTREQRIREAIRRADLPYDEVVEEVDGFVAAMDATALRAQMLYEALADTPPQQVAARLESARGEGTSQELVEALATQLSTLDRMQRQLDRFYSEMERMIVELGTVRSQLVTLSASAEAGQQTELASEVRGLRERMGAVAEGIAAAYEEDRV
jgi:uncharacterized coiled-coil protein SlyX